MINRKFTNISCKALGQLISLKDSASRKVAKNSVYNKDHVYYLPSIRLFILLNFKVYTKDGSASNLVIKELAEEIGCCPKTVISALEKLSTGENPLISYSIDEETKLLSIKIDNYTDMFKRAGEGGLRYLVFSESLLKELKAIDNINEMRLALRALIECEEQEGKEASLSLKDILSGLPAYIRPCNVRNYVSKFKYIIKTTSNPNNSAYLFQISLISDGKSLRNKMVSVFENALRTTVSEINQKIYDINTGNRLTTSDEKSKMSPSVANDVSRLLNVSFEWRKAKEQNLKVLPTFHFRSEEFEDAALIATHLDLDSVIGAIKKYMEEFVLTGRGSTRKDTMAIIQNISEHIYNKKKMFFSNSKENNDFSDSILEAAY